MSRAGGTSRTEVKQLLQELFDRSTELLAARESTKSTGAAAAAAAAGPSTDSDSVKEGDRVSVK